MLSDSDRGDVQRPCVVFNDDITLEEGCGYRFGGFDNQWDDGEEIQLKLHKRSWANKFYDPRISSTQYPLTLLQHSRLCVELAVELFYCPQPQ